MYKILADYFLHLQFWQQIM